MQLRIIHSMNIFQETRCPPPFYEPLRNELNLIPKALPPSAAQPSVFYTSIYIEIRIINLV